MKKPLAGLLAALAIAWAYWVFFSAHSQPFYPRVGFWIEAAQCAQKTGHYLVICKPDGTEVPVEDASLADDRGHTLILSFLAHGFGVSPSESVLRTLNITLCFFGFALLTWVLFIFAGWRSALFTTLIGLYWIGARAGPDVDATYIGISLIGAAALMASSRSTVGVFMMFPALTFVALVREPIGLGLSLSAILMAIAFVLRTPTRQMLLRSTAIIAIAILALKAPSIPSRIRDAALGTKAVGTATHGLSHNLFLGLGGFVENKWGIVWDDAFAEKRMHELYPDIKYCSDEYFKAIGALYKSYIFEDPREALRVYSVKTLRTFSAAEGLAWSGFVSLALLIGLAVYLRRKRLTIDFTKLAIAIGPILFGLSFIGQGILTHPAWTYIYPGPILLMISTVVIFEQSILSSGAPKPRD